MDGDFLQTLVDCLRDERPEEALRLVAARHEARGDGVLHFWYLIVRCAEAGRVSRLRALDEATSGNSVLKLFTHFGMAYVAAWEGDIDETTRRLRLALRMGSSVQDIILNTHPDLAQLHRVLVQQVQSIDAGEISIDGCNDHAEIDMVAEPHRLTVLTSCNGKYFERFASNFIDSISEHLPHANIHIHVMNPTPDNRRQMEESGRLRKTVKFSAEECREEAERFACGRFVVAHDVMQRNRSDLLISDIDVNFTGKTAQLGKLLADDDAGMFERKNVSPMEICHCSLAYFRFTDGSLRLLALLRNYLKPKLNDVDHPEWMLDQCAVFVVTRRATCRQPARAWEGRPTFKWRNLTAGETVDFSMFQVNQAIGAAEKYALRYHAEENLQVRFVPLPDGGVSVRVDPAETADLT